MDSCIGVVIGLGIDVRTAQGLRQYVQPCVHRGIDDAGGRNEGFM